MKKTMKINEESGEYDFNIVSISIIYLENRDEPWERSPYISSSSCLTFCLNGDYYAKVNNKSFNVKKNNIVYFNAGDYYHSKNGSLPFSHIGVHFLKEDPLPLPLQTLITPDNIDKYRELFYAISNMWTKKVPGYKLRAKSILYEIIARLIGGDLLAKHSDKMYLIKESVNFLENNYLKSLITTEQLAEMSHLSVNHFIRIFKEVFNATPIQYINEKRIRFSAELLINTNFKVKEISNNVGYLDSAYFCRMFKKIMGMTPSQYQEVQLSHK